MTQQKTSKQKEPERKEIDMSEVSSVHMYFDIENNIIEQYPYAIPVNYRGSFKFIPYSQFLELQGNTEEARKIERQKWAEERGWISETVDVLAGWHEFLNKDYACKQASRISM